MREHGAQHHDPWSLVWLVAWDQAADGGSERELGLPQQDDRTHQSRRHRGSHQAARRGGPSGDLFALPGKLDAITPADVDVSRYDLVGLAMQEPQYANHTVRVLIV